MWITFLVAGGDISYTNCYNMENLQIVRIIKVGNSLAVVIPVNILRALKIQRGDAIAFGVYENDNILIRKITQNDLARLKPHEI